MARDEVKKLAQGFVVLHEVFQNLPLLDLLETGAFRTNHRLAWLHGHSRFAVPISQHLVDTVAETRDQILRELSLLCL